MKGHGSSPKDVMSIHVRILQCILIGLVGFSLILYSSNYTSTHTGISQRFIRENHLNNEQKKPVSNGTAVSEIIGRSNLSVETKSLAIVSKPKTVAITKIKSASYFQLTREVYDAGHLIVNPDICPDLGEKMKLLVLITSSPNHIDPRLAIRQTWGHYAARRDIGLAFFTANTKNDSSNELIRQESDMYGDIIQANFIDSYDNLTLKTISMLEWVDNYCPMVPFIMKTDDDMFINIPRLLVFLKKHSRDKKIIFGKLAKKWKPIRKSSSKYYIPSSQYKAPFFPDFTTGPAYVLTNDSVHDLYFESLKNTYLKLEDVFMTGIVAQKVAVKRAHAVEFFNKRIPFNTCVIRKLISIHMIKPYEQFVLWEKLHDTRIHCKGEKTK